MTRPNAARALLAIALVFFGLAIGRYASQPLDQFSQLLKITVRDLKIAFSGSREFARKDLERAYVSRNARPDGLPSGIDTSALPLTVREVDLTKTGLFAIGVPGIGGLGGGGIVAVNGRLLVMDRLGSFFTLNGFELEKLDLGTFPSNLDAFLTRSHDELQLNAFRTHDIVYDHKTNSIYVSHEMFDPSTSRQRFAVSTLRFNQDSLTPSGPWQTLFESEDMNHTEYLGQTDGGGIAVDGQNVFFATGDHNIGHLPEWPREFVSQDAVSSFGKVFSYDLEDHKARMVAKGFRNPQGMVVTDHKQILVVDQGPRGGDEIDRVAEGGNYGWPYETLGTQYGTFSWPVVHSPSPDLVFTPPLFAWIPSVATSTITQVSGFNKAWDGDLLVGSLKAQSLYRLRLFEDHVMFSEPIFIGRRIRHIVVVGSKIVLMTDEPSLIFISVDEDRMKANKAP